MIISHKFKFIFIKTRKTAGTSIEVYLSGFCDKEDILTPISPESDKHEPRNYGTFYNHVSASEVRSKVGDKMWGDYFTFCIERNPWDKTISYFHMQKALYNNSLTLEEYFTSQDFCNDYMAYTDPNDRSKLLVDRVLHYENLSQHLSEVFMKLGIPFDGRLDVWEKSDYRTDRRSYRDILSKDQAKIIENRFQTEIKLFNYHF